MTLRSELSPPRISRGPAGLGKARRLRHRPRPRAQEASMIRLLAVLVRLKVARWRLARRIARR